MIVSAKGINPSEVHVFSLALFMTVFFGVLIGYIFVFWFASAFPVTNGNSTITSYTEEDE